MFTELQGFNCQILTEGFKNSYTSKLKPEFSEPKTSSLCGLNRRDVAARTWSLAVIFNYQFDHTSRLNLFH